MGTCAVGLVAGTATGVVPGTVAGVGVGVGVAVGVGAGEAVAVPVSSEELPPDEVFPESAVPAMWKETLLVPV